MDLSIDEILKLRESKVSLTKIAEIYGVSRESIRQMLLRIGAYTGEFHKSLELNKQDIIKEYTSGKSLSVLARKNNCNRATISGILRKNNIEIRGKYEQVLIEKDAGLRKSVNRAFFDSWSDKMTYVLGWIATDGCIISSLRGFNITSTDIDHLHKLAALLQTDVKIAHYAGTRNNKLAGKMSIGQQHMIESLMRLGIHPKKSKTLELPPVPDEYLGHFLRGVFEGDGTVFVQDRTARIHVYSASKKFLPELNKRISTCLGIKEGSIYIDKRYDVQTLYFGGHERISRLYDFMYKNVPDSMILKRKHDKFLEYFMEKTG